MNMLYLYPMHLPMVDGQAHECSHYTENLCYNEFLYNSLSYYHSVFKDLFFAYYYFVYVSKLSWVYGHYIHAGGWGGQKWMSGTLELEFCMSLWGACWEMNLGLLWKHQGLKSMSRLSSPNYHLLRKNPSSSTFDIQLLSSIISKYTQIFFKIF